jgi:hypothetical protein
MLEGAILMKTSGMIAKPKVGVPQVHTALSVLLFWSLKL